MKGIVSIAQHALHGIRREIRALDATAREVAGASGRAQPTELAEPLVRALEQQRALEAAAAVLRRADEAFDSLL
jgi:hypothetical protein